MSLTLPGIGALSLPSGTTVSATPAQFDNSQQVPSTAFLQRALGNASSMKVNAAPVVMDASYAGADVVFYGHTAPFTQTLLAVASFPAGAAMRLYNPGGYPVTIKAAGADIFSASNGTVTSIVLGPGDSLHVSAFGGTNWEVMGGTAAAAYSSLFSSTLGVSGYQKLPSGMIVQWGVTTFSSTSPGGSYTNAVTFPIAFPGGVSGVAVSAQTNTPGSVGVSYGGLTLSGCNIYAYTGVNFATLPVTWFAWGK